ncbi:MAG: acylphosphatase [Magnetovibrio sp.]|nr:acylphosphatase [Magnetovibrio sp.]|tara:strand:- start:517 stop:798 length:282 start_codon:yes stop_codon:yes gene_type:complete
MNERTVSVIISGQVQGVGFRWWTVNKAKALGINGWVRNRKDGSVEALFSGSTHSVDNMINECYSGPFLAIVDKVEIDEAERSMIKGFSQALTI